MKRTCYVLAVLLLLASEGSSLQTRDPFRDAVRRAEKEALEKNFRELKEAAAGLAVVSKELSDEIDQGSEHVISARVFDKIERIEKLTKQIKDKARGW
jgi:hypothetical protein